MYSEYCVPLPSGPDAAVEHYWIDAFHGSMTRHRIRTGSKKYEYGKSFYSLGSLLRYHVWMAGGLKKPLTEKQRSDRWTVLTRLFGNKNIVELMDAAPGPGSSLEEYFAHDALCCDVSSLTPDQHLAMFEEATEEHTFEAAEKKRKEALGKQVPVPMDSFQSYPANPNLEIVSGEYDRREWPAAIEELVGSTFTGFVTDSHLVLCEDNLNLGKPNNDRLVRALANAEIVVPRSWAIAGNGLIVSNKITKPKPPPKPKAAPKKKQGKEPVEESAMEVEQTVPEAKKPKAGKFTVSKKRSKSESSEGKSKARQPAPQKKAKKSVVRAF